MKTTTVLSKQDRESLLKIISGARHHYLQEIVKAAALERRQFYQDQLTEADRLTGLLAAKETLAVEDEEENDEEEEPWL